MSKVQFDLPGSAWQGSEQAIRLLIEAADSALAAGLKDECVAVISTVFFLFDLEHGFSESMPLDPDQQSVEGS